MLINPVATGIITIGMFFSLINATFDLVHTMSWSLTTLPFTAGKILAFLCQLTQQCILTILKAFNNRVQFKGSYGMHNELMAAKQLYYTMYDSQRRWYQ